jgi:hypothetical protein
MEAVLRAALTEGKFIITGGLDEAKAKALAARLKPQTASGAGDILARPCVKD